MKKILAILLLATSNVFAGPAAIPGSITYSGLPLPAQPVPTLNEFSLAALALLVFALAFRILKDKLSSSPMSLLVAIIAATIISGGSSKIISEVYADVTINLEEKYGTHTVVIPVTCQDYGYVNNTQVTYPPGVILTIDNITLPSGDDNDWSHTCSGDLSAGTTCRITCDNDGGGGPI